MGNPRVLLPFSWGYTSKHWSCHIDLCLLLVGSSYVLEKPLQSESNSQTHWKWQLYKGVQ